MKTLLQGSLVCMLFLFVCPHSSSSQTAKPSPSEYKNTPVWISMIDNPATNYYEAIKAYDSYWENHVKPLNGEEEEEGFMNESQNEREQERAEKKEKKIGKRLSKDELKAMEEKNYMILQIKRFENWKREVAPFVQEDGRILSLEERAEIWNKQQSKEK
ncbi:MAG: hypothetical protein IPG90_04265 [Bacteroidetes bacterium]|nr:hypothetical protein [Bacteroidota bacterium]